MGETVGQYAKVRRPGDFRTWILDVVAEPGVSYLGHAWPGESKAEPIWQIRRITTTVLGGATVEWADGNAEYDNVWNDRASLNYS
jgi:hypothetical protein